MKTLFLSLILAQALLASEYFAKAEPVETFSLKASVSGQVLKVDESKEGKFSDGTVVIMIDDKVDVIELEASKQKLNFLDSNIKLSKQSVANSLKMMKIDKTNYQRVQNLSSYSKVQKDAKLLASINSTNAYIQSKTNLENLKTQRADLTVRIARLEDSIAKKNIQVKKGLYIYKLYPTVGDFVSMGAPLLDSKDISKARLTIYVTKEDLVGIKEKKIFIDGKETDYKIDKLWTIADTQNISAYKTEIVVDKPAFFSALMKVEFK